MMIIKRQKQFVGLQDGFCGKKGLIKKIGLKRASNYNNLGPWEVIWGEVAGEDYYNTDEYFTSQDIKRIDEIINWIKKHPWEENSNKYSQHPLFEFVDQTHETVVWSAEINKRDRLVYLVSKVANQILVINCRGHNVIDIGYSLNSKNLQKNKRP